MGHGGGQARLLQPTHTRRLLPVLPFPCIPPAPGECQVLPTAPPQPWASFCHGFQRWWLCLVNPEHKMGPAMDTGSGMGKRMGTAMGTRTRMG